MQVTCLAILLKYLSIPNSSHSAQTKLKAKINRVKKSTDIKHNIQNITSNSKHLNKILLTLDSAFLGK